MVFYRKYRPQKIDDLDSEQVRNTLTSVLSQKSIPHAFLFTGPKGLGKTSTARIVAKIVNCTGRKNEKEVEPCNKCEACKSITEGTNLDILEIDAASNRGIDEIRDLKEKIRLTPSAAKMKVYIIDEVHMLTTEAFNALLKTLEEPPEHVMFILCTTEPQKVPSTIESRCFHILFAQASKSELIRSFKRIIREEKIEIDEDALSTIADLAEGGFRDGAKILEEVSLLSGGKKITQKIIDEKYKVTSVKSHVSEILKSLSENDTKKSLKIVSEAVEIGIDVKFFIQQMIETLHNDLLGQIEENAKNKFIMSIEEEKLLIGLLTNAYQDTKFAVIPQLPIELVILEWAKISSDQSAELHREDNQHTSEVGSASVLDLRKQVGDIKKIKAMYGSASAKQSLVNNDEENVNNTRVTILQTSHRDGTKEWVDELWKNIISEMKAYNHTIAGVLRGCSIASYDKKNLIIQTSYKFHKERLDDVKVMSELSRITKMLTGKDVAVVVELRK